MLITIDTKMVKEVGCSGAMIYEYIRQKCFEARGEVEIGYDDFMNDLDIGSDKTITKAVRKLQDRGLLSIKKTGGKSKYRVAW